MVQVGFQGRSNPVYQRAKPLFRSELRETVSLSAQYHRKTSWRFPAPDPGTAQATNWRLDPAVSTGLAGEIGAQQFDVAAWYREELPIRVAGRGAIRLHHDGREIADTIAVDLTWADGVALHYAATLANSYGGQFENQSRAMKALGIIAPVVILLIATLLFITFRSWRLTGIILLNLPFALTGGVIALKITGIYLSVPASIGFIVLFGVAVLNGMVLIAYLEQLRERGHKTEHAVLEGSVSRLRPVLMTALIAMASLIPLILSHGTGNEIQRQLATVVIGGLVTATLGTLFLLPLSYTLVTRKRQ